MTKKFDLAAAISSTVSELDTAQRKQIEYIDIDLIDEDKRKDTEERRRLIE